MAKAKTPKLKGADLSQAMPQDEDPVNNYTTRGHLQTLTDAHDIMNDPVKLKKVHALAGRHMDALKGLKQPKAGVSSTDDLRAIAQKKYGGPGGGPQDSDGE
jgi:hypothetical protein